MKYKEWLNIWLENYIKPTTKKKTYIHYYEIVQKHIIPKLGDYDLDGITPIMLQKYITSLLQCGNIKTGKGLTPNSVNSIINVLQGSLKTALNIF